MRRATYSFSVVENGGHVNLEGDLLVQMDACHHRVDVFVLLLLFRDLLLHLPDLPLLLPDSGQHREGLHLALAQLHGQVLTLVLQVAHGFRAVHVTRHFPHLLPLFLRRLGFRRHVEAGDRKAMHRKVTSGSLKFGWRASWLDFSEIDF